MKIGGWYLLKEKYRSLYMGNEELSKDSEFKGSSRSSVEFSKSFKDKL